MRVLANHLNPEASMNENDVPPGLPGDAASDGTASPGRAGTPTAPRRFWQTIRFFLTVLFVPPILLAGSGFFGDNDRMGGLLGITGLVLMPCASIVCAAWLGSRIKRLLWQAVAFLVLVPLFLGVSFFLGFAGCVQIKNSHQRPPGAASPPVIVPRPASVVRLALAATWCSIVPRVGMRPVILFHA